MIKGSLIDYLLRKHYDRKKGTDIVGAFKDMCQSGKITYDELKYRFCYEVLTIKRNDIVFITLPHIKVEPDMNIYPVIDGQRYIKIFKKKIRQTSQ